MKPSDTLEQAVQKFLTARTADPKLTPEDFCHDAPQLLPGLMQVLQAITLSRDGTATFMPVSANATPAPIPVKLGAYVIQKQLGEGGMGTVYLGTDPRLDRAVAVKVMRPEIAAQPLARARFLREAKAMAAVKHEHVATIFAASEEPDGTTWLAMELLEGETLDDAIKASRTFDWKSVERIGREIALGLSAAHAKKLIHRDIKPANIWLEAPEDKVKLLDFGLARQVEADAEVTGSGALLGTPAYMAPEQANGETIDHRCDLFSLGVLLYRLITGKSPFIGPTVMATLTNLATKEPTPITKLRPDCPASLADLIHRLLAKQRDHRPPTAKAVADELLKLERDGSLTLDAPAPMVELMPVADPWASIDGEPLASSKSTIAARPSRKADASPPRTANRKSWLIFLPLLLLLAGGGYVIIRVTNKDGTTTELKVPDPAKIELVDDKGKTVAVMPLPKEESKTPAPVADKDKIDHAAERKAAEQLLALNVRGITLEGPEGVFAQVGAVYPGAKLPDKPFYITKALLTDSGDEALALLRDRPRLDTLTCDANTKITDAGLKGLRGLARLETLSLRECRQIGDTGLEALAACPNLRELDLVFTGVTDEGLKHTRHCPTLRRLTAPGDMTTTGLAEVVNNCHELRQLSAVECPKCSLSPLEKLPRLSTVDCLGNRNDPADARALLKQPYLAGLTVTDPSAAFLGELSPLNDRLRSLRIRHRQAGEGTTATWEPVFRLTELEELTITGSSDVDDDSLTRLAKLPRLKSLNLELVEPAHSKITPAGASAFRNRRPDVNFSVLMNGKAREYPALANWPGKSEGDGRIMPWNLPKDSPPPAIVPFTAEEAKKHQEAWAKHIGQPVEVENKIGMKFRLIPPGEFETNFPLIRGTEDSASGPKAQIRITNPFYLGSTEVTFAQFQKFADATNYKTDIERGIAILDGGGQTWRQPGYATRPEFPVAMLSLADCQAYCDWLNSQEPGTIYRLPTETEWEYAARAGREGAWAFGKSKEEIEPYAWLKETLPTNTKSPQNVRTKRPNDFGLHDVIGNVHEQCIRSGRDQMTGAVNPVLGGQVIKGLGYLESFRYGLTNWWEDDASVWQHVGFRVLRQTTKEPLVIRNPYKVSDTPIMVRKGQPLGPRSMVSRPATVPSVRSWSIELAGLWSSGPITWHPKEDLIAIAGGGGGVFLVDRQGNFKQAAIGIEGNICSIGFSPDGKWLAVCDRVAGGKFAGTVRLFETTNYTCRMCLATPAMAWVHTVVFSPVKPEIALLGVNGFVELIDYQTGAMRRLSYDGSDARMDWSANGDLICVRSQNKIIVHNLKTRTRSEPLVVPKEIEDKGLSEIFDSYNNSKTVAYSPDGLWLAATSNAKLHIWNAKSLAHVKAIESASAFYLVWHPDSKKIAIYNPGQRIEVLDIETGKAILRTDPQGIAGLAWSPNGKHLAGVLYGWGTHLFDIGTGKPMRLGPDKGHFGSPEGYFSQVSNRWISKSSDWDFNRIFDGNTGDLLAEPKAPVGKLIASDPRGQWLAYATGENTATIIHDNGKNIQLTLPSQTHSWQADPTGQNLAALSGQKIIGWNVNNGKLAFTLEHAIPANITETRLGFTWAPDGKKIASTIGDAVHLWDAQTGKKLRSYDQFPRPIFGSFRAPPSWQADDRDMWVPLGNYAAKFDTETGRLSKPINLSNGNLVRSLAAAPDGEQLLSAEEFSWNFLASQDGKHRLLGQHLSETPIWHPDARRFIGSFYSRVNAFDTRRNHRLGTLWPHLTDNHWLCVGPDGHYRGSKGVESQIIYVAQLEDGSNQIFTPEEFAKKFGWKNDPAKARLMKPDP
ncbi:protein kinase domain-containing protein [Zavarzinella formosa]|uniref:protein kinase domain-containing protein n=1 Tax=Zavarzinella formosa TaxID=360055 RepID=UPI0002D72FC9|nr:protein kinase [Zavarzinella formosa]